MPIPYMAEMRIAKLVYKYNISCTNGAFDAQTQRLVLLCSKVFHVFRHDP